MTDDSDQTQSWFGKLEQSYYQRWEIVTFCMLGMSLCIAFGLLSVFRGDFPLATALLLVATTQGLLLRHDLRTYSGNLIRWFGVAAQTLLFYYLLITGGFEGTGPLWCIVLVPSFIYLLGPAKGSVYCVFFFVVLLALLISPLSSDVWNYTIATPDIYRSRFFIVCVAFVFYIWLQEYSRARVLRRLSDAQKKLEVIASTDSLTGLPNRREMERWLESQERRSGKDNEQYGLVIADIDYFKQINDNYGHHCGDEVIARVAQTMKNSLRENDLVSRWGGEEFLLLLPQTDLQGAMDVSEKLRKLIEVSEIKTEGGDIFVTMSFGVAVGDQGLVIDDCLKLADSALYQAKEQGRNQVCHQC
jgi:diguanylate cyclase (GGDEF)-like protein